MNAPLIDSHAHLDMLDDPQAALELARESGGGANNHHRH